MSVAYTHNLHHVAELPLSSYFRHSSGSVGKTIIVEACATLSDCVVLFNVLANNHRRTVALTDLVTMRQCVAAELERAIDSGLTLRHLVRGITVATCEQLDNIPDLRNRAQLKSLHELNQLYHTMIANMLEHNTTKMARYDMLKAMHCLAAVEYSDSLAYTLTALHDEGRLTPTYVDTALLMHGPPVLLEEAIKYMTATKFDGFRPTSPPKTPDATLADAVALCRECGLDDLHIMQAVARALQK